jgi:photosystem II stability/assembly factor-like uncharacterized protein
MSTQFKLNSPNLIILAVVILAAFGCEQKITIETDKEPNNEENIWQQTALDTFSVIALATSPNGSIFAATCSNGMFRSMDRGASWTSVSKYCTKVIAIRENGDIFAEIGSIILRSMDNGATWKMLGAPASSITSCVFNTAGEIFVGSLRGDESRGGIYRSNDNGVTWLKIFPDSISVYALAINKEGVIFAGTGLGIVRSFDNGQTWRQINYGLRRVPFVSDFAINPINGDIFVANMYDGIYRSSNNGDSWLPTGLTLPPTGNLITVSLAFNSVGYTFAGIELLYPPDPLGVFYSTDNGTNWSPLNSGLTNKIIIALTIDESGYVYAGTDGNGVFRTIKSTTTK